MHLLLISILYIYLSFGFSATEMRSIKKMHSQKEYMTDGQLYLRVAKLYEGRPYKAGLLDVPGKEACILRMDSLDCVTFFENSLAIAYLIRNEIELTEEDITKQLTRTRYRNGIVNGYNSRLHYTADWILQNSKRNGVVEDITKELGGEKLELNLNFMSQNPQYYSALKENPDMIAKIEKIEQNINSKVLYFIPKNNVQNIENQLQDGDIIAITTNKEGLDYSHLGIAIKNGERAKLMHASSKVGKVIIDTNIHEYLAQNKTATGITILRPKLGKNAK